MICNHCGAENDEGAVFCEECGQKIAAPVQTKNICPHCGAEYEEGTVFCDECGKEITADEPEQQSVVDEPAVPQADGTAAATKKAKGIKIAVIAAAAAVVIAVIVFLVLVFIRCEGNFTYFFAGMYKVKDDPLIYGRYNLAVLAELDGEVYTSDGIKESYTGWYKDRDPFGEGEYNVKIYIKDEYKERYGDYATYRMVGQWDGGHLDGPGAIIYSFHNNDGTLFDGKKYVIKGEFKGTVTLKTGTREIFDENGKKLSSVPIGE
ncbi:MAG: zinc ribbon domain-containing protein [Ruminiclostridium sp.]|nr:zinc ribbon domain-containing protein [Ruminiclostridium sp.]